MANKFTLSLTLRAPAGNVMAESEFEFTGQELARAAYLLTKGKAEEAVKVTQELEVDLENAKAVANIFDEVFKHLEAARPEGRK